MVEVGRDVCRSPGPTPLLKQGHLGPSDQDRVQTASKYLQGWRLHNLPGQPAPVLHHPHSKKVFLYVQMEQFVTVKMADATHV